MVIYFGRITKTMVDDANADPADMELFCEKYQGSTVPSPTTTTLSPSTTIK